MENASSTSQGKFRIIRNESEKRFEPLRNGTPVVNLRLGFPVKIGLFIIVILCAGCRINPQSTDGHTLAVQETKSSMNTPLRFLALGDSYTIGESVAESERWPDQLAEALVAEGIMMEPPEIIARTGWTTGELLDAIGTAQIQPPYQLVSLLIGVNNQYRGYSQEEYRAEFAVLLTQAIDFAGGDPARVLVVSIPDWGVTPYAERFHQETVSREIDAFNKINRQEADRLGVHYVDVTSISRRAEQEAELIAEDGLHPSGKMYSKWIEVILPAAQEALGVGEDR